MALSPRVQTRIALAFLVLPVVAAVTAGLIFPAFYPRENDSHHYTAPPPGLPLAVRIGIAVALVSVPLIAASVALFATLVWRDVHLRLRHALAAGVVIGNLPVIMLATLAWFHSPPDHMTFASLIDPSFLRTVAFDSAIGVACAAVFWLTAGRMAAEASAAD